MKRTVKLGSGLETLFCTGNTRSLLDHAANA